MRARRIRKHNFRRFKDQLQFYLQQEVNFIFFFFSLVMIIVIKSTKIEKRIMRKKRN